MKVRETTKHDSWTIPEVCKDDDRDRRADFFHQEQWDELHIVHKETKELLARYTRAQVFGIASKPGRKMAKTRSGGIVSVHEIKRDRSVQ